MIIKLVASGNGPPGFNDYDDGPGWGGGNNYNDGPGSWNNRGNSRMGGSGPGAMKVSYLNTFLEIIQCLSLATIQQSLKVR